MLHSTGRSTTLREDAPKRPIRDPGNAGSGDPAGQGRVFANALRPWRAQYRLIPSDLACSYGTSGGRPELERGTTLLGTCEELPGHGCDPAQIIRSGFDQPSAAAHMSPAAMARTARAQDSGHICLT